MSIVSVSDRIAEFARFSPDAVAISLGLTSVTFAQLDQQSRRFAEYLRQQGVSNGSNVALCFDRSIEWIVAALGIMRAGAAYVPLDTAWPDSRLSYSIADAGARVIIASQTLVERLSLDGVQGLDPFRDRAIIEAVKPSSPRPVDPNGLAYLIYTSGSSGVPKGVEITHANLANLLDWHRNAFAVSAVDRASQFAGLGFDAAVWEIWGNLCAGATLCLADDSIRTSPELMQHWIVQERITISFVPTVHASSMINMVWPENTALRYLLTGGEALLHAHPRSLPFTVVNNYGPTECTVVATSSIVVPGSAGAPPIGLPILGTVIYLLDENLNPVSDGQIGEIFIGGHGLGRGYRNLPEATAKSFIANPLGDPGAPKLYRTGDRGRRRSNGEIEFAGRLDRQTKIRGQRIELDEIGSVLESHPAVRFATAVVRRNTRNEDHIVSYLLFDGSTVPSVKELQSHLLERLPEYMVPALFVQLSQLPLSANGKIDLNLLPASTAENILEQRSAKRPTSKIETQVLEIIRDLLKQPAVSLEDNFFLAGGHSLLGMQLVMRLRNKMRVDFTLRELFESPTAEKLAAAAEQKLAESKLKEIWISVLEKPTITSTDDFFSVGGDSSQLNLLHKEIVKHFRKTITREELAQHSTIAEQVMLVCDLQRSEQVLPAGVLALRGASARNPIFWAHYLSTNLARAMGEDQAFIHVSLTPEDLLTLNETSTVQEIAACLVPKVIATDPVGPYILGGYCLGGILAYEMACQLEAAGHAVALVILLDTPSPSYFGSPHLLTPRLTNPGYLLKRVGRLGLKTSLSRVRKRVEGLMAENRSKEPVQAELDHIQSLIEHSASSYSPRRYRGKVALILAEDHPPHIDFLTGWRTLIPETLHAQYLLAHHDELMSGEAVQNVANAMASQIKAIAQQARGQREVVLSV